MAFKYWFDPKIKPLPPEYEAWCAMKKRCNNPNHRWYHRYGGRGIKVCPQWQDNFLQFLADVGFKPNPKWSLERVDNDKGYEPGNVLWASSEAQLNNTCANNRIAFNGKILTVSQWARELGTTRATIYQRLHKGWPIEKALTHPREIHVFKKAKSA